jgi:ferritin-like metal-binding protein YciE
MDVTGRTRGYLTPEEMKALPLHQLFLEGLQDMYWGEARQQDLLMDVADASASEALKDAVADHLEQTAQQVSRIARIFDILGEKPAEVKCQATAGLIKEIRDVIFSAEEACSLRDAALIVACQKLEHYEISSYGSLLAFARLLGLADVSALLLASLDEEKSADALLTDLAESFINQNALVERD